MLYVTGDTHGDYERFTSSALKKLKKGDTLFICGDFGFIWDGSKNEEKLLKKIGKLKYNVCFIDGTHENFDPDPGRGRGGVRLTAGMAYLLNVFG